TSSMTGLRKARLQSSRGGAFRPIAGLGDPALNQHKSNLVRSKALRNQILCYCKGVRRLHLPQILRSLSARLLVLTMFFVMVSEVMIFAPSVARFRISYLQNKIDDGHLA